MFLPYKGIRRPRFRAAFLAWPLLEMARAALDRR